MMGIVPYFFNTTHAGQTRLFPLPRWPCLAKINCLQVAFLKALVLLSSQSFLMSPVFLIQSCRTSVSRHNFVERDLVVMHFLCLQHLFSVACGIGCKGHMYTNLPQGCLVMGLVQLYLSVSLLSHLQVVLHVYLMLLR